MFYQRSKTVLRQQGLAASKKLGQNFLVHKHTAEHIADLADLSKEDTVIEVGVGLGALTGPLAERAGQVIGLEMDSGIIRLHEKKQDLPNNVRLLHQDVLTADFSALAEEYGQLKIVANLPYSISSPFLFKLIEHSELIDSAVVMLQKEVAARLLAQPGTKDYGAPTVLLAACATVELLLEIGPEEFHPQPKVDSLLVRLVFHPVPERVRKLDPFDQQMLKRIVSAAFGQRRKTLFNGLAAAALASKEELAACIAAAGLAPAVRAERLSLEDFVHLARLMSERVLLPTA
ncbi:MAG: dimethyladenosine transferase [Candidatus Electronema aureum]|uniref:Ribosomal RNA small subunit methyltransferase A n=1 Tax=Candidatus Electronema aureum TaxID=2005002 RepID=A0A521FZN6_9BACT|nr:MAG: dimethyladenosine transferase [Candidatus Electronema aureum]